MALITMRQAITDALREEMHRDERVFIMGPVSYTHLTLPTSDLV